MPIFNINTDAVVKHTLRLEKISKVALPRAILGTLNNAAYDVKTNTMPQQADEKFEHRQPNFFKANSKYIKATGFNVDNMKAIVGFTPTGLKGSNNFSVKDLEQQETGGAIQKKSFIPMKSARISGSIIKNVRAGVRLAKIKNIVDSKKIPGNSDREKFRRSVYMAGVGGFVLGNREPQILWRVNSLKRAGALPFKLTPLYNFKRGRSIKVRGTGFMKEATGQTIGKMEADFMKEADRQINKYWK